MAPADPVEEWRAPVGEPAARTSHTGHPHQTAGKQKAVRSTSVVLRTASEF